MKYIFTFILLIFSLCSKGQCYVLNEGKGLKLFSPFLNSSPKVFEIEKGRKFGDSTLLSSCNGRSKKWVIEEFIIKEDKPIYAAISGLVHIYTVFSNGENHQTKDGLWIESDSISVNYQGLLPSVVDGQYIYEGQNIGKTLFYNGTSNLAFGVRLGKPLNPMVKRGLLGAVENPTTPCFCNYDPIWPENFVDPTKRFVDYYKFNQIEPNCTINLNTNPRGIGSYSFDNGKTWHNGGSIVNGMPFSFYKIIFKNVYGYSTPKSLSFLLSSNEKDIILDVSYIPDYTIIKRPEADLQRQADKKEIEENMIMIQDSLYKTIASKNNDSFTLALTDSFNRKLNNIESIQNDQVAFSKIFKYILPILALALAFIVILFMQNKKITKQNESITLQNKKITIQKNDLEIMQREQHHRVHNNLAQISSLLSVYGKILPKEKILELDNCIQAIANVHVLLYKGDDLTSVDVQMLFSAILENLKIQSGKLENLKININTPIFLPQEITTLLALIINELATNSIKYGMKENGISEISIYSIGEYENGSLTLFYKDNGLGYQKRFYDKDYDGYGKVLIVGLSKQIRGEINFYNNNGAAFTITINENLYA